MLALGCRTAVGVFYLAQQLAERLGSEPVTAADAAILAELDMRPDDFVRFVVHVYDLG